MTDRELLGLAAKAAGVELAPKPFHHRGPVGAAFTGEAGFWNPLHDDGDALRLAVRLNLLLGPEFSHYLSLERFAHQEQDDAFATRRAIVRAAAEIGRNMP